MFLGTLALAAGLVSLAPGFVAPAWAGTVRCAHATPSGGGTRQDGVRNKRIRIVSVNTHVTRMEVKNASRTTIYSRHPRVGDAFTPSTSTIFIKVYSKGMGGCLLKYEIQ